MIGVLNWRRPLHRISILATALAINLSAGAASAQNATASLTIRNHRFEPETLEVPAGQKIELTVINADATPEEFESGDLRREKVVAANSQITVYVGPLRPGTYEFFGDFNPKTARGHIVAK